MINRRNLLKALSAAGLTAHQVSQAVAQGAPMAFPLPPDKKGIMLMNRIGPSSSELYVSRPDVPR